MLAGFLFFDNTKTMRQKRKAETDAEQLERLKSWREDRILGGTIIIEDENARFEVWAYRKLSKDEMLEAWAVYEQKRDRRRSIRGQTIRVRADFGRESQ